MIKPKKLWIHKPDFKGKIHVADNLPVSQLIAKILMNRGIKNPHDMISFLNPDYSGLHDSFLLKDMEMAVKRILNAIETNQRITIYGDYDVDGITSTSILFLFLKENNGNVDYYIPDRIEEGYGLNIEALKKIRNTGTDLVITVDTGIAAANEVEFAKKIGLDIIITDHHECQEKIPEAYAVIDPKQRKCNYPFKSLAGVGVAFKLIQALATALRIEESIWKYMEIVALGTVADVVPLIDENRIFVKKGFENIPNTWNVGLRALLKIAGYKTGVITTGLIGFGVAPRLNAAGRMGDAKRGIELFITENEERAIAIAEELNEENKNRQLMEQGIIEEAIELIERDLDMDKTRVIVIASKNWHHGVIGISASRIMEKYYRPTILMCIEDGVAKGSARSIEGFNIFEALSESSKFLTKFGGHEMASGLSMEEENIDNFRIFINQYANDKMDKKTLTPKLYLDEIINISDIDLGVISELEKMEPFGAGNPQPLFSFESTIYNTRPVGKENKHLKITFGDSNKHIDAIGFGFGNYIDRLSSGQRISTAVSLEKNEWNNTIKPQLYIRDLKSPKEEEIAFKNYISLYNSIKNLDGGNPEDTFNKTSKICYTIKENIPIRADFAALYRYLRLLESLNLNAVYLDTLIRECGKTINTNAFKILICMDIFMELDLLQYRFKDDRIIFKNLSNEKVHLEESKILQEIIKLSNIPKG